MKKGLYANINTKKKRIAAGSGEKMRKPGTKGAPTNKAFIQSAKTAKKKWRKGFYLDWYFVSFYGYWAMLLPTIDTDHEIYYTDFTGDPNWFAGVSDVLSEGARY